MPDDLNSVLPDADCTQGRERAEVTLNKTMRLIQQASTSNSRHTDGQWRSIADLRSESIKLRRKTQRANRPEAAKKTAQYKEAKRVLGKTIQRNKASCWQTPTHVIDTVTIDRVVNALFPTHPRRDGDEVLASVRIGETTLIAEAELISAVHCMKNRKEQKVITTCFLHLLLRMYKEYLIAGIFPV